MKQLQHYITLYGKSLKFVGTAAPLLTLVMVVMIPIQALLPSVTLLITNQMINQLSSGQTAIVGLLVIWGIIFLLNNVASPLNTFIQGQLTDQLTYALNEKIMRKSEELQTIDWYEQSDFHNKVELLSSEASWRPVNLLVFGTSLISNVILVLSMIGLLMTYHWLIAVAILVALIPQSIVAYKVQQQAFETLVSNSEDSRKLTYYANTLLTADAIKEVRLYRLYDYFKKKYYDTFTAIKQGVQKNRQKQFLTSAFFLVITGIISVVSFFLSRTTDSIGPIRSWSNSCFCIVHCVHDSRNYTISRRFEFII